MKNLKKFLKKSLPCISSFIVLLTFFIDIVSVTSLFIASIIKYTICQKNSHDSIIDS